MTKSAYEDFIGYCVDQEHDENDATIVVRTKSGQTLTQSDLKGFNLFNADEITDYVCITQSHDEMTYVSLEDIETLSIIKR